MNSVEIEKKIRELVGHYLIKDYHVTVKRGDVILWLPVCNQKPIEFIDALFTLGRQLFAMQYAAFSTNVCGEAWLFALPAYCACRAPKLTCTAFALAAIVYLPYTCANLCDLLPCR